MKYISADQFLNADKNVQETILEWWKPSVGDIYCNLYNGQKDNVLVINKCQFNFKTFKEDIKKYGCPLLTEGQLREFLEDRMGWKLEFEYNNWYEIKVYKYDETKCESYIYKIFGYDEIGNNEVLLQALWKVVNQIILKYD